MATAPANIAPQTLIQERYRIERLVSQGGMGAVYRAIDERLGSTVAIKHILVSDSRLRKAFEREARLLASLRHPALPVVNDHFREGNSQFLVMQYIDGDDLGTLLERNGSAFATAAMLPKVIAWADRLLDVLDYLHSHQPPIVHRDIKPQNLKLTPRGDLVLLDFGLAKGSINSAVSSMSSRSLRSYTTQYAPLEQIQGTGTEPRSDLYALAATLYHMLTGEPPPNALTRASSVLAGQPDPLRLAHFVNTDIPPALAAVLQRALSPGISKRFESARKMRAALRSMLDARHAYAAFATAQSNLSTRVAATNQIYAMRLQDALVMAQELDSPEEVPSATLIVSKQEQGYYTSIRAAIAEAQPGSEIMVRPGVYQENLIIDKRLKLLGDGPRDEIIIESSERFVLMFRTDFAIVRGISLRSQPPEEEYDIPQMTVHVAEGQPALEDCEIVSSGRLGVLVQGETANPMFWRCVIQGSQGVGMLIQGSRGMIEECEITGHGQAGIAIRNGGDPIIRRSKITHNEQDGIYIDRQGMGSIEECEIAHNLRAGIEVKGESSPFIRRCNIHNHVRGYGIFICENSESVIEDSDVYQNARGGIAVLQQSQPLVRRSMIRNNRQRGVLFSNQTQGALEQCTIQENDRVGVEIKQESTPTLRQCTIKGHSAVAVWVHDRGGGQIERCDLGDNGRGAWHIEPDSEVMMVENEE